MSAVFFSGPQRISLSLADVRVSNLARIFKVDPGKIYLVDDANRGSLPSDDGYFSDLQHGGHYEVSGGCQPVNAPQVNTPPVNTPPAAPAVSVLQNPSFSRTGFQLPALNVPRRAQIRRKIQVVEWDLETQSLTQCRTTYVSLNEGEVTISSVAQKVAESLNTDEEYVLLDNRNNEIVDCFVTRQKDFWQMQSRVIKACSVPCFQDFQNGKGSKKRKSTSKVLDDLDDVEKKTHKILRQLTELEDKPAVVMRMSLADLGTVCEALACVICKGPTSRPVASGCCSSLLGCKNCLDEWWLTSSQCPKCQDASGEDKKLELKGLDEVFGLMLPITGSQDK